MTVAILTPEQEAGVREIVGATIDGSKVDGAALLNEIAEYLSRYVVLRAEHGAVLACWAVHTFAIEAAETTPYLEITSAEKESGKTRLLEALNLIVWEPWLTGSVSAAVLARKTAGRTLLLDESDAAFKSDVEYAEALRGILNSGYRRGGTYSRCAGNGADLRVADFPTFGAKAIAGIGKLPDTVASRALPIGLKRRAPGEDHDRFYQRTAREQAEPIRERAEAWAMAHLDALGKARPALPEFLSDRAADCCEPLIAIAELAGGPWPNLLLASLKELYGSRDATEDTVGVRLLSDVRDVFGDDDRMTSADLLNGLHGIEEAPWGDWYGKPLAFRSLAKMLRPYGIKPDSIRIDEDKTPKGYMRAQFEDAWTRYLPPPKADSATAQHSHSNGQNNGIPSATGNVMLRNENGRNPACDAVVADVADKSAGEQLGLNGRTP
jgi:hypothetical protein